MPSLFSSKNQDSASVKYFQIRVDESNIVLRGTEEEAPSAILKGTLVLCLSEPLSIKNIRMRFTGEKRLAWYQSSANGANYVKHEEEFTRHTWDFKKNADSLPAGNYEWPFDVVLPGSAPESLEGLHDTWIIYRMKATIERGMLQQNFVARKQVRIIRSLDPTALELVHSMSVENVWPDKIQYSFSTPTKAVIFGSFIHVDFKLIPLLKGLEIGKIVTELIEKQDFTIKTPKFTARSHQMARTIHKDEFCLPSGVDAEDIEGQEGYMFSRPIPVPQSLRKCVQTIDCLGIKVRHSLNFNIQLHNPDGHVSELHATLPVHIFLSPNLPIDDNNNLVNQGIRNAITANSLNDLTPPQYGEHQFDQLYSDIDPSGYMTPNGAGTGANTPVNIRSRSVSADDLASADAMASSSFAANVLQNRLSNLDIAAARTPRPDRADRSQLSTLGDGIRLNDPSNAQRTDESRTQQSSPPSHNGGYFAQREGSSAGQTPSDRLPCRMAEEENVPMVSYSPEHVEYSAETLAKVPSYSTALRSNPRILVSNDLPSYQTAIRSPIPTPPISTHSSESRTSHKYYDRPFILQRHIHSNGYRSRCAQEACPGDGPLTFSSNTYDANRGQMSGEVPNEMPLGLST